DAHRVVFRRRVEELNQVGVRLQVMEELPHQHLKRARVTIKGTRSAHACSPCWRSELGPGPPRLDRLLSLYCRGGDGGSWGNTAGGSGEGSGLTGLTLPSGSGR